MSYLFLKIITEFSFFGILSFLIGSIVFRNKKITQLNNLQNFVLLSFIGSITIATITAVYITSGHTEYLGVLILIGLMSYFNKSDEKILNKALFSSFNLPTILCLIASFVFGFLIVYGNQFEQQILPPDDYIFYTKNTRIMDYLNHETNQTVISHQLFNFNHTYIAYHYYELWNALFSKNIFGTLEHEFLLSQFIPYHFFLILLLCLSLLEQIKNYYQYFILIAVVSLVGLTFENFSLDISIKSQASLFTPNTFKSLYFSVPIFLSLILLWKREFEIAILVALTCFFINILLLFFSLLFIGTILVYLFLFDKKTLKKSLFIISPVLIFLCFYLLNLKSEEAQLSTFSFILFCNYLSTNLTLFLTDSFYFIFPILAIVLEKNKSMKTIIGLSIAILIGLYISSGLLFSNPNTIQIYKLLIPTFQLFWLYMLSINIINIAYVNILYALVAVTILGKNLFYIGIKHKWENHFSPEYVIKVSMLNFKNPMGAGWRKLNENKSLIDEMPNFKSPGKILCFNKNLIGTSTFNTIDWRKVKVGSSNELFYNIQKESDISKFVILKNYNSLSDSAIYINFMNEFKFEFLIAESNSNPPKYLIELYSDSIKDNLTGEVVYYNLKN